MNILVNKNQYINLLNEGTTVDEFLQLVLKRYPQTNDFIDKIKDFIDKSGCNRIETFRMTQGMGLSLHDRVVISDISFSQPLPKFLFILFHEIAHQYQYRKYGDEKMYECYTGEISIEEAAEFMKKVEIVADEFATRKVREFVKLGFVDKKDSDFKGFYKNIPLGHFITLISSVKKMIKNQNVTKPDDVSELFYNWIKNSISPY
jgi:hypothetical protein